MTGLRYFALQRLFLQDEEGEPFTAEAGELIPAALTELWGDRGVYPAVSAGRIAPLPAALADLLEQTAKPRRRTPVAA